MTNHLAAPGQSGVTISGGVTGGTITFIALALAIWLVFFMVKKDKLKIAHLVAVTVMVFVFQLTPLGQLAFQGIMTGLDGLANVAV